MTTLFNLGSGNLGPLQGRGKPGGGLRNGKEIGIEWLYQPFLGLYNEYISLVVLDQLLKFSNFHFRVISKGVIIRSHEKLKV